ncbi:MAG: class II glutamine amidotransferase [Bacteriovoracaceae bacterium]|jgi:glutamine amidotransferase|nr:class II glutamine amidotransferase [Bacteriovoracaceae bacterium]
MCRIFAFRSKLNSKVHSSLLSADKALGDLSKTHPDGWGVAYYQDNVPHLIKSLNCAVEDKIFHKVSAVVASRSVIAHIRKATQGENSILNSHPFQFGSWIYAHNGNIKNFNSHRNKLLNLVDKEQKRNILGQTDSEIIFHIILSELNRNNVSKNSHISQIVSCVKSAIEKICFIIGPLTNSTSPCPTENYLTMALTCGQKLIILQAGQPIWYSTYKKNCPEKSHCSFYNKSCEKESSFGQEVNHLIVSSEPLSSENIWKELQFGEVIYVDENLKIEKTKFQIRQKS